MPFVLGRRGCGTGGGEDSPVEGSRYVWTWPDARPIVRIGCVGWRAEAKTSVESGSVQTLSKKGEEVMLFAVTVATFVHAKMLHLYTAVSLVTVLERTC